MTLDRRTFLLGGASALGAGGILAACTSGDDAKPAPQRTTARPFDAQDWGSVREQFDLPADRLHFSAFVLASHPAPVRAAIERHRIGLDTDAWDYLAEHELQAEEELHQAAADYLGSGADEVAFTESTTAGLGLLYGGLRLSAGDDVVTTEHDFYSSAEALRLNAAASAASVRRVRLYDDPAQASTDQIVSRLVAAVRPRTRVVAVTWVHSSTGVMLPIRAIADALADINAERREADRALLCVDGVHGLGVDAANVTDLGCDFLVAGTHKWLCGPRGTGIIWGRAAAWPAVRPVIPSFAEPAFAGWLSDEPAARTTAPIATPGGYRAFEHRWALTEAFRFQLAIGKDRVAGRIREQAGRLKDGLAGLSHVRLITPRDPGLSAGLVCCSIEGMAPQSVVSRLRSERITATRTPYADSYVRFGPSLVTSPEQVDQLVRSVAGMARTHS